MTILIKGGYLITMDNEDRCFYGDLLIEKNYIKSIGQNLNFPADQVIDATGMLVLPGFVQSHVHLCQALFRGQADDQGLVKWLNTITKLESYHTPETLYASARLGLAEMIKSGVTGVIDMGTLHYQDSIFYAIEESGIRAQSGKAMMDLTENLPSYLQETTEASINESMDLLHRWHGKANGRIHYGFSPRWQLWVTEGLLKEIKKEADIHLAGIHGHAGEIQDEVQLMIKLRGHRNLKYLENIGVVGTNVQMAHCIWLDDSEMQVLVDTGTHVLHCPCCNAKLGSGIAKIHEMLGRGINVALGSDGAPSNNNYDMFIEMRFASLLQKYRLGADAMPAASVLRMATYNGAKALDLGGDEFGCLQVGKKADIILLNDGGLHAAPFSDFEHDDPVKRIVSAYQSSSVHTSIIDGQIVLQNGKLLTMDEAVILDEASKAWNYIKSRL